MKKRTSKIFAVAMALVMMLSMTLVLTSCGGSDPQTFEEYVAVSYTHLKPFYLFIFRQIFC